MTALVQSLCWTLIHSLWIGCVIGILAGVLMMCTRRSQAAVRYNLLAALLGLFLLSTGFVFYRQLQVNFHEDALSRTAAIIQMAAEPSAQFVTPNVLSSIADWCNNNALWIVTAWLLVFFIKLAGMIRDLVAVHRLRTNKVHSLPEEWNEALSRLALLMKLNAAPLLRESVQVSQPVVIGFFKPLILVPAGLLMRLPADEAEAILLHELAHIRRHDYLVNLLQHFTETLFFFHPAIWWLSSRMDQEREHCCDDRVIAITGNKEAFMRALVSFSEVFVPKYALGFKGRSSGLVERVQHIINGSRIKFSLAERLSFIVCIILGIVLLAFAAPVRQEVLLKPADTNMNSKAHSNNNEIHSLQNVAKDTLIDPKNSSGTKRANVRRSNRSQLQEPVLKDSFPPGASKDFIAGYRAAMRYRDSADGSAEKKRIEMEAIERAKNGAAAHKNTSVRDTTLYSQEALRKKAIEERLVRERN